MRIYNMICNNQITTVNNESELNRTIAVFSKVIVQEYAYVKDSVILPDVQIGKNCVINRAIVDKGCIIPDGMIIGEDIEDDKARFRISEKGIVLVTPDMLRQDIHQVW